MPATLIPCPKSKTEGPDAAMNVKGKMELAMMEVPLAAALKPKGSAG
jgi:hypothetical protein